MPQRLLFSACVLLVVASLDARKLHKKSSFVLPPHDPATCDDDRVKCPTSDRCIPQRWFCDGDNDCGDASDESDCPPVTCSDGQTKCRTTNICRPTTVFCDGKNDCGDNSDESEDCRLRSCPEGQLKCNSGQCIDSSAYCAGNDFCRDNTQFIDFTCPDITCDPGNVKCPRKSKCIKSSFVCDGDNDCGDLTDEPANCRERSCSSGEFKCGNGQCLNRTGLCLSLDSYGCRDGTDTANLCSDFTCPTGFFKCVSDGKCTARSNLCDGYPECSDGSDESREHCDSPLECEPGQAQCPSVRRCISTRYFCDTDNDCRDNSDEDELFCKTRTCQPNEVRCRNGQCLDKNGFCNGQYSCRDGSYGDTSDICPNQGSAVIESNFSPGSSSDPPMPSQEERSCFMALMQLKQTCNSSLIEELFAMRDRTTLNKFVEMDLSEICGAAQELFGCFQTTLSPCVNVENPITSDVKQTMSLGESVLNYVCVQHVEVFNRNKACLLKEDEAETYWPDFTLVETFGEACERYWTPPRSDREVFCSITDELHGCVKDIVAGQCGDEVAGALSGLADIVVATAGCTNVPRLRSLSNPHTAIRQLGSGDEEEYQCMMALISVGETCGESPFQGSEFDSTDSRVIYDQLVASDLRKLCSMIQPWYECMQQAFSSCAYVNNPMIAEMKRMLPLAGVALDYVCVQHIDVFNSGKACLLRESRYGPFPSPLIAETFMESCAHHIQPANGDPICTQQVSLEACAKSVVTAQCGSTLANALGGLNDVIRSAAGCPARRMAMRSLPRLLKQQRGFPFNKKA